MSIEAIRTTISDYIRETFQVPADDEEFTGDVHLFDYGYVDSLGAAGIIAFIEKK
ncbi:MAG: phosphopantetheine-binding protein [Clostridia bacterium]|nr:phosphopantetheine-binding protein [Clostridia bacterium]